MRSLIVDDEFSSRLMIQCILAPFGESHTATNAHEAIEAVSEAFRRRAPYDLICLDIVMPDTDCLTVLRQIRSIEEQKGNGTGSGAKVVMATIPDDANDPLDGLKEHCDWYIVKPVSPEQLIGFLHKSHLVD